ncbi:unnamed protein product [Closterium sp. NIES-53]
MSHAFLTGAAVASPGFTSDFGKIPAQRQAPSTTGIRLAPVRTEAPHVIATVTASPISAKVSDAATSMKVPPTLAEDNASRCRRCKNPCTKEDPCTVAPDFYPFTSLPPTPVFPSHAAMAQFLQSYARMLQHVQTATSGVARIDPVDRVDHSQDALVSGESLAAAGTTVLKRVRVGIRALLRHPEHGVPSGRGGAWCAKKERAEEVLAELERDIEVIRSAHERPPRATTLALATIHCFDAARIIRTL